MVSTSSSSDLTVRGFGVLPPLVGDLEMEKKMSNHQLARFIKVILFMIVSLMALGAGVRTMNAGLSCPDWPLCFGQVIPDFHPAVWFEFVHRAYAGIVALCYLICCWMVFRSKTLPKVARKAVVFGLLALGAQIVMGGLTVLLLVKSVIVTSHLVLATLFFSSVFWLLYIVESAENPEKNKPPQWFSVLARVMPILVFAQLIVGGFVASTYAGSVCVDWPLCNGEWVPTWQGAIGLQIAHRFFAYGLIVVIGMVGWVVQRSRQSDGLSWVTPQLLRLSRINTFMVALQVAVGIANLLLYIPAHMAVLHQSVGVLLFAVNLRIYFVVAGTTVGVGLTAAKNAKKNIMHGSPHSSCCS